VSEILVVAENRQGHLRDITFEMLTKAIELTEKTNSELTAVILGKNIKELGKNLAEYCEKVLLVDDEKLENFNSDIYQQVLSQIIKERKPILTIIGHTSYGVELAPRLAAALDIPLATDCIDMTFDEGGVFTVKRQIYGGKVNVKAVLRKSPSYMVTMRQGIFQAQKPQRQINGQIIEASFPVTEEPARKRFLRYVMLPPGGVDITAEEVLVGIGRGIKDQTNIPMVEELAKVLGGVLVCSRPVIDKGWLPPDRQVGTSGKIVKPKLYIALGISGAFHHVLGMKNSNLIIAVNKDAKAPIFNYSDYGVIEDLFKIVPPLKNKISELQAQKAN
jgi:electron transfer flavoprotein alpha subunit